MIELLVLTLMVAVGLISLTIAWFLLFRFEWVWSRASLTRKSPVEPWEMRRPHSLEEGEGTLDDRIERWHRSDKRWARAGGLLIVANGVLFLALAVVLIAT